MWEPPSLEDCRSNLDLRQYGDPDRVIGLDVVDKHAAGGTSHENSMPEVVAMEPKHTPVQRPATEKYRAHEDQPGLEITHDRTAHETLPPDGLEVVRESNYEALQRGPLPPPLHSHRLSCFVERFTLEQQQEQQRQQRPQEQPSARTTLGNAFRALLWPIKAHAPDRDNEISEEGEDEVMSQFVPSEPSPFSQDGEPSDHDMSPGPYSPLRGPLKMPYYHVDSAENAIYHQWVNRFGPSMGGTWVPVNQAGHGSSRRAQVPAAPELFDVAGRIELPADSVVELPADSMLCELDAGSSDSD